LLQILQKSSLKNLKLHGVDMSVGELEAAKLRLRDSEIQLVEGRAQELPFIDASMDFVFCHLALMLMGDIGQVLMELRRCLKTGGTFSAVIGGSFIRTPIMDQFGAILSEIMKSEKAQNQLLGDPRIRMVDETKDLFQRYFSNVEIKEFELNFSGKPEELMDFFMLTYQVDLLSDQGKKKLRDQLLEKLKAQTSPEGILRFPFALRQITAIKAV
jgi:ubiquinone/menaquinone biosynthesis C-methylase UbiE